MVVSFYGLVILKKYTSSTYVAEISYFSVLSESEKLIRNSIMCGGVVLH